MSALSITAPQFTDEDALLEQETYSEEELKAARADVWGETSAATTAATITATSKASKDCNEYELLLDDFRQALDEVPFEEKEGYLEALERAPLLVETESNPELFLQAEQHEPWPAAERFVNYWELRKWLFGERAWLPLTATGDGALTPADVELLETGFCCLLPKEDKHGRGILCFQVPPVPLLSNGSADRLAMARVTFYMLSLALATRPETVGKLGLVVVADTKHYTLAHYDRKFLKCVAYFFTGYHPVTTRAYHMTTPPGAKSCFQLVLPFVRYFMTRPIRQRFQIHRGTTQECAIDLNEYGMETSNLPVAMGGQFTKEQFVEWLHGPVRERELQLEQQYVESLDYDEEEHEPNDDEEEDDDDGENGLNNSNDEDEETSGVGGSRLQQQQTPASSSPPPTNVVIGVPHRII